MNKVVIKRVVGAIGIIALINVGVFSYLHFFSGKIKVPEKTGEIAAASFQAGSWEMKITRGDSITGPSVACLTDDEIKEFYSEEWHLKELASYSCKTEIAQISKGYEITGTACRHKSAEFSILVKYQKTDNNAFTVYRASKSKTPEIDFTETTEIRRLGDCK